MPLILWPQFFSPQNLALSDLLFVTICIPPTAVDYAIGWPFGDTCCKLVQYLVHITTYKSVYTLVLLSLDRYLAVVYPVKSISLRTVCNTKSVAIALTWKFTLLTCTPIIFMYNTKDLSLAHGVTRTICTLKRDVVNEKIYQSVFMTTSLVLPLIAIVVLYINMLIRLWRGSAATHGPGPARDVRNSCKGKENKRRVTRMIVVVIIVFAMCWTPLQLVLLLKSLHIYDINSSARLIFQIVTQCLAYCNSCLNPILYAFFSPNFRLAFLTAMSCATKRNGMNGGNVRLRGNGTNGQVTAAEAPRPSAVESARRIGKSEVSDNEFEMELQPLVSTTKVFYFVAFESKRQFKPLLKVTSSI